MKLSKLYFCAAALVPPAFAASIYTTDFAAFSPGDVNGQFGWGYISNSPTVGSIVATPGGAPAGSGPQSLHLSTTSNSGLFGVSNGLFSPRIDPAGEPGAISSTGPTLNNHFTASLYYRTPDAFTPPTTGTIILGLNPSFTDPGHSTADRYAFAGLRSDGAAGADFTLRYYDSNSTTLTLVVLGSVQAATWYQLTYELLFVPGTNLDGTPNDVFRFTVSDAAGNQLGSATGSTWEDPWRSGSFFGTGPRGVNGFDFLRSQGPTSIDLGYLASVTFASDTLAEAVPEPSTASLFLLAGACLLMFPRSRVSA